MPVSIRSARPAPSPCSPRRRSRRSRPIRWRRSTPTAGRRRRARPRRLRRSGGRQAGHLLPAAGARRRDARRDRRLHGAEPRLANQALLERRRQEAIAAEPDVAAAPGPVRPDQLHPAARMLRCADAWRTPAATREAADEARRAWIARITDPAASPLPAPLDRAVRPDDQRERFERLVWHDPAAAARQVPRLDPAAPRRGRGAAGAAARTHPTPRRCCAALPAALAARSRVLLDHARWLRHADRAADALRRGSGWRRRAARSPGRSARRLLGRAQPVGARACCSEATPPVPMRSPPARPASRRSRRWTRSSLPASSRCAGCTIRPPAARALHALAGVSKAAITQGRAHYWLGARRRRREAGPEAGICARRRVADDVLWPACRAGAGRRSGRARTRVSWRCAIRLDPRPGAGLHRPRSGARRGAPGRLGRSAPRAGVPAAAWTSSRPIPADRALTAQLRAAPRPAGHRGVRRPPHGP